MLVNLRDTGMNCLLPGYSGALRKEECRDAVVPDTLPDLGAVLNAEGTALIRSKDLAAGRVRIEAELPVRVLCVPEDGGAPVCLELTVPFFFSFEDASIGADAVCEAALTLTALEARLLNPRKASVRAELLAEVRCREPGSLTLHGAPDAPPDAVQLRESERVLTPLLAATEKPFAVTDEFTVPETPSAPTRILSRRTALRVAELRGAGTKLILRGSADSALLLGLEDGGVRPLAFSTDFSQVIETGAPTGDGVQTATLLLSGAHYALSEGTGRSGTVELHLVAFVRSWGRETARCLTDAYSNRFPLTATAERLETDRVERVLTLRESARGLIPTDRSAGEVLQCWAGPGEARTEPDGLLLPVRVAAYYRTPEGELCAARGSVPVKLTAPLGPGQSLEFLAAEVPELNCSPADGGLEARLTVEARALLHEKGTLEQLAALELDEDAPLDQTARPTLVILRADADADLWQLAKENCSTEAAIRDANGLDDADAGGPRLLLIPKAV